MGHGTRSGRPVGRQRRVFRRDEADHLLDQGLSYREVSRRLGVPVATLYSALRIFRRDRSEKASPPGGCPHSNDSSVPTAAGVRQGSLCGTEAGEP